MKYNLVKVYAWQARGDRFESGILHQHKKTQVFRLEFFGFNP
jgi:hypothetical protein